MKRDPLLWGALVAVLVVLASAEYDLARACGFGTWVAAGVPGALDIYAVKALRAKRDVTMAVVALILVNAASHLVSSGILPVRWPLVVAVSAIAPLVLWRVHRLSEEPGVASALGNATPAAQPVADDDAPLSLTVADLRQPDPVVARPIPEVVPAGVDLLPIVAAGMTTEVTIERADQEPNGMATAPWIKDPWEGLGWPGPNGSIDHRPARELTGTSASAEPRQMVTMPVVITPSELLRMARKLNKEVVAETKRPVTIERLQSEYNLSRRDAAELRREVVGGSRS